MFACVCATVFDDDDDDDDDKERPGLIKHTNDNNNNNNRKSNKKVKRTQRSNVGRTHNQQKSKIQPAPTTTATKTR